MKTNWINVKDKLPDNDREVLVIVKYTDIPIQAYYKSGVWNASFEVREFIEVNAGWNGGTMISVLSDYDVTHWIELPKLIKSIQL